MTSRPIRVLHVVSTGRAGGIESFVEELVRHIDRDRFDISVCIVGDDGPVGDRLRAAGCRVFSLGSRGRVTPASVAVFARQTNRHRFDILHLNSGGAALRLLARLSGCRATITHVHSFPNEWVEAIRRSQPSLTRTFARTYGWGSHRIIVASRHMEVTLLSQCPSLAPRVERVPHGVDLQRFRPTGDAQDAMIGFVGRLSPEKGVSQFLTATAAVLQEEPGARFMVVGDGVLRTDIQTAVTRKESAMTWLGERDDVQSVMPMMSIVAVPSQIEAFGMVCLEAMACGRPVVAFDVGGIPEVVIHGETGLLVPAGDIGGFASALLELLRRPEERRRLGLVARARVESLFDVRNTVRAFESLYEAALPS